MSLAEGASLVRRFSLFGSMESAWGGDDPASVGRWLDDGRRGRRRMDLEGHRSSPASHHTRPGLCEERSLPVDSFVWLNASIPRPICSHRGRDQVVPDGAMSIGFGGSGEGAHDPLLGKIVEEKAGCGVVLDGDGAGVDDGVGQTPDSAGDRDASVPHRVELAEATGLESTGHEEPVGAREDPARQGFIESDAGSDSVGVATSTLRHEFFKSGFSLSEDGQLNVLVEQVLGDV